jgi:hypothetical protein
MPRRGGIGKKHPGRREEWMNRSRPCHAVILSAAERSEESRSGLFRRPTAGRSRKAGRHTARIQHRRRDDRSSRRPSITASALSRDTSTPAGRERGDGAPQALIADP